MSHPGLLASGRPRPGRRGTGRQPAAGYRYRRPGWPSRSSYGRGRPPVQRRRPGRPAPLDGWS